MIPMERLLALVAVAALAGVAALGLRRVAQAKALPPPSRGRRLLAHLRGDEAARGEAAKTAARKRRRA